MKMSPQLLHLRVQVSPPQFLCHTVLFHHHSFSRNVKYEPKRGPNTTLLRHMIRRRKSSAIGLTTTTTATRKRFNGSISASLDLTEDNVKLVLADARQEFPQIFDTSVGMTGVAELAEVDGPFVKISLKGRFWHERSLVLARLGNYLKQRIPEILEVDIEDEKQLDDSPANF